jgi:hypothetical protein
VNDQIGLAEFIAQVKRELLEDDDLDGQTRPLLLVDTVELEVQITTARDARGGIKVQVLAVSGELGAGAKRENTHKVRVTLSPIMTHAERVAQLRDSDVWPVILKTQRRLAKNLGEPNKPTD